MSRGCLIFLLMTVGPRLVLLFIWLFTLRVTLAFNNFIWPLLGFIFLPFTTLLYVLVWSPTNELPIWGWLLVLLGLLFDLGAYVVTIYGIRGRLSLTGPSN